MSATLNMFDLIFIFSTIFIVLIAFFRGFVKEFFSLINFIFTTLIVFFLSPFLSNLLDNYLSDKIVANITSFSIIFIIIFIISTILTRKMAVACQDKIPDLTNKIIAVLYGFVKTLFIFGFIYSLTTNLHISIYNVKKSEKLSKKMPIWLYDAKVRPIISPFGNILNPIVLYSINQVEKDFLGKEKKTNINKNLIGNDDETPKIEEKKQSQKRKKIIDENYEDKGYTKKEIEKMNRLIEIVE